MAAGDTEVSIDTVDAKQGAWFNGVDSKIAFTSTTFDLDVGTTFVLEAMKTHLATSTLFMGNTVAADTNFLKTLTTGKADLECKNNGKNIRSSSSIGDEKYHTYVFRVVSFGGAIFLDGTKSGLESNDIDGDVVLDLIGSGGINLQVFAGVLRNIRIFDRGLSDDECVSESNNPNSITDGLIHHWPLATDSVDVVGGLNGTATNVLYGSFDEQIATELRTNRVSANDIFLMTDSANGKQVITSVIEEAP